MKKFLTLSAAAVVSIASIGYADLAFNLHTNNTQAITAQCQLDKNSPWFDQCGPNVFDILAKTIQRGVHHSLVTVFYNGNTACEIDVISYQHCHYGCESDAYVNTVTQSAGYNCEIIDPHNLEVEPYSH